MELSEPSAEFRLQNNKEVSSYLKLRGYGLFQTLKPQISQLYYSKLQSEEESLKKTMVEDNWTVRVKEIKDEAKDYCQYEIYSEIKLPTEDQLDKLENEGQLFCHSELMKYQEGQNLQTLQFGLKIGCKLSDKKNQWVEKWAIFVVGPRDQTLDLNATLDTSNSSTSQIEVQEEEAKESVQLLRYKYFSKFWYEIPEEIHSEFKFQHLSQNENLLLEYIEKSIISNFSSNLDMKQLMCFTTYFNSDFSQRYQTGFKLTKDILENWKTDFHNNTYEKESSDRAVAFSINGEREGRNEYGQVWHEKWYSNPETAMEGWSKWTEIEDQGNNYKWGEGQENQGHVIGLKRHRWQEKLERQNDYWEKVYEEETLVPSQTRASEMIIGEVRTQDGFKISEQERSRVTRKGCKEFKNNRNYIYNEKWTETMDGIVLVERESDDGLGTKKTEKYQAKNGLYECSDDVIDKVGENQKIIVNRGKNENEQNEWESARIIDFRENFDTICKSGRNYEGQWRETWYDKGHEKWARKEGENFATKDQWQEEWLEKNDGAEKICKKWGKSQERNEEWNESWGETFTTERREKWSDKWVVDWNSGLKKGQNWGHEYNENMEPKHHWCEEWDSNGNLIKREEHY